ncbi:prepilin-type N-terminal cleavage/methylation domain-containing protein [Peribacillus sp. SCS-37]|uniref:type IV pilus modification PilV family protein n=1 Tax=Paraperibacillus esterisolvens TaxID=3115296 RepID=UPI0039064FC6
MKILNKNEGFSLLEVLIAVTLLGILLLSVMGIFNQAYNHTKQNESKTIGINVARNVLNYVERQPFEKIQTAYFLEDSTNPPPGSITLQLSDCLKNKNAFEGDCETVFQSKVNNVTYEAEVTISRSEGDLSEYIMPLSVEVKWGGREAIARGVLKNE